MWDKSEKRTRREGSHWLRNHDTGLTCCFSTSGALQGWLPGTLARVQRTASTTTLTPQLQLPAGRQQAASHSPLLLLLQDHGLGGLEDSAAPVPSGTRRVHRERGHHRRQCCVACCAELRRDTDRCCVELRRGARRRACGVRCGGLSGRTATGAATRLRFTRQQGAAPARRGPGGGGRGAGAGGRGRGRVRGKHARVAGREARTKGRSNNSLQVNPARSHSHSVQ